MPAKFIIEEEIRYIIKWHNGIKYLVKDTCDSKQDAEKLKAELEEREKKNA